VRLTTRVRTAGVEEQEVVVDRNNPLQRWSTFLVFAASQASSHSHVRVPAAASTSVLAWFLT